MAESKRRVHDGQLKARVVALCSEPGASVARIALEHGLNANLVHRWRRIAQGREPGRALPALAAPLEQFVPVPMIEPAASPAAPVIQIELRRGPIAVSVQWPASAAPQCAGWLRELLR